MKKTLSVISAAVAVALAFSFDSCGFIKPDNITEISKTSEETTASAENTAEETVVRPPMIITRQELENIPVAVSTMSNGELRNIVVSYMALADSIMWTPFDDYWYYLQATHREMCFDKGKIYSGQPYNNETAQSLYGFMDFIDPETGVLKLDNNDQFGIYIGTDCADAVAWAWARVTSTADFKDTSHMTESSNVLRVGPYKYPDNLKSFDSAYTASICKDNGKTVMNESYALVMAGDAFVKYGKSGGHAILAASDAVVVRNPDGSVNPDKSYIGYIDQNSKCTQRTQDGATVFDLACLCDGTNVYTFTELYSNSFIPITCKELAGKADVQKAKAEISGISDGMAFDGLNPLKVTSNYRIAKVKLTISDPENGKEIYSRTFYGNDSNIYSIPVNRVANSAVIKRLGLSGKEIWNFSATVGSGETLTVFNGHIAA